MANIRDAATVSRNPEVQSFGMTKFIDDNRLYITQSKDIAYLNQKENPALFMIISDKIISGLSLTTDDGAPNQTIINNYRWSNKFILTSIQEERNEKIQVFETFGKPSIFFFGERSRIYSLTGYLVDGFVDTDQSYSPYNKNWGDNFKRFYDEHFRGSLLAKYNELALISVTDNLIFGYPISLSIVENTENPLVLNFRMNFIVVKHTLPRSANPDGSVIQQVFNALNLTTYEKYLTKLNNRKQVLLGTDEATWDVLDMLDSDISDLTDKINDGYNLFQTLITKNSPQLNNDLTPDKAQDAIANIISDASVWGSYANNTYNDIHNHASLLGIIE